MEFLFLDEPTIGPTIKSSLRAIHQQARIMMQEEAGAIEAGFSWFLWDRSTQFLGSISFPLSREEKGKKGPS